MTIPVVDLAMFDTHDTANKLQFVNQLGNAYEEVGFVAVKNHGIPDELIKELYKYVQQFFSLPLDLKRQYEVPGLAGQRGYTSFGKEHAKGSEAPDLKEFFQYGQITDAVLRAKEGYPENVRVKEVEKFNATFEAAYHHFEASGKNYYRP